MTNRHPIERRLCSDQQGFTHGLVRATAKMERAKQLERKAKSRRAYWLDDTGSILLKEHRPSTTFHHSDAARVAGEGTA